MTLRQDLDVPAGATWQSPTWALLTEDGLALPITGWTVRAQVRRRAADETALITFGSAGAGAVDAVADVEEVELPGPSGGGPLSTVGITLRLTAAQSALLGGLTGVYDLHVAQDDGEAYRVVEGAFRVREAVTR